MEDQWLDYVEEFKKFQEILVPDFSNLNFKNLRFDLKHSKNPKYLPNNWVPYEILFLVEKDTNFIIGAISIRYELSDYLYKIGGNIGYGIRPTQRGKNNGTTLLFLGLKYLKENLSKHKLEKVLITCDERNIASKKIILKNGGIWENTIYDYEFKRYVERYWIYLNN